MPPSDEKLAHPERAAATAIAAPARTVRECARGMSIGAADNGSDGFMISAPARGRCWGHRLVLLLPSGWFNWPLGRERADCRVVAHRGDGGGRIRRIGAGKWRHRRCGATMDGSSKYHHAREFREPVEKRGRSRPLEGGGLSLQQPRHEKTLVWSIDLGRRRLLIGRGAGFQSDKKGFGGRPIRLGPRPSRRSSRAPNKRDA